MKVSNEVYKKLKIDWANITFPLKEGSPVSLAGVVANNGNAIGLVPQTITKEPLIKSIYILAGGDVDLAEIEETFGTSLETAAKANMSGLRFWKADGTVDDSADNSLPSVTADDDGDVLTVVSGAWAKTTPSGGGGSFVITATTEDDVTTLDKTWQEIYDALADGKYCVIVESAENYATQTFVPTALDGGGSYMIFASEDIYSASSASGYPSLGGEES